MIGSINFIELFFGAALGLSLQVGYEFVGQLRAPRELFGIWHSSWQPTTISGSSWVTEKLEIKRTLFGIKLINSNNSGGFEWKGKAKLINNKHLIGEWKSTKPGSTAEGVFALVFHIDGSFLTGFFQGQDFGQASSPYGASRNTGTFVPRFPAFRDAPCGLRFNS